MCFICKEMNVFALTHLCTLLRSFRRQSGQNEKLYVEFYTLYVFSNFFAKSNKSGKKKTSMPQGNMH